MGSVIIRSAGGRGEATTGLLSGINNNINSGNGYNAANSVIAGGSNNQISATARNSSASVISGGKGHTLSGSYSFIGGGYINNISSLSSNISGGTYCEIHASYAAIAGGQQNVINASGDYSFIGSGSQNTINASYSSIAGGVDNVIGDGAASTIAGGVANVIGDGADGATIIGGGSNSVTASYGVASGCMAKAYLFGMHSASNNKQVEVGDNQRSDIQLCGTTSDATSVRLGIHGNENGALTMRNHSVWYYDIMVVGITTDAEESTAYRFKGLARRGEDAAATTLVGSQDKELYETTAGWDATVTANTSEGSLDVTVIGDSTAQIWWNAHVHLVEIKVGTT